MTDPAKILSDEALDILFRSARTYNGWLPEPVSEVKLQALYDLLKMGPTSANTCPARFIFVASPAAKEKLRPCLAAGNVDKTMAAPVVALIINDTAFTDKMTTLMPHNPTMGGYFSSMTPAQVVEHTMRNATLQGAYLILAARSLGLDCGPMSGFDKDKLKAAFFPDEKNWEANFICSLGRGDPAKLYPRLPRLAFDEACDIV